MTDEPAAIPTHHVIRSFSLLGERERKGEPSKPIGQVVAAVASALAETFQFDRVLILAADGARGGFAPIVSHGPGILPEEPFAPSPDVEKELKRGPRIRAIQSLPRDFRRRLVRRYGDWTGDAGAHLLPIVDGSELVGLLAFRRAGGLKALDEGEADLLRGMCRTVAAQLRNGIMESRLAETQRELEVLRDETREVYRQAVMAFLTAIDIKDGYTKEHSLRVARMSSAVAAEMGFNAHEVEGVYFAGLLHDIGKILVDKHILTKPGSLDLTEYAEMSRHSDVGAEIVSTIPFPWENLIPTIRHHHDRPRIGPNASGHGGQMARGVNIIGLTDAFDAMTSDRPYRRALTFHQCIAEILNCLGVQFDPETTRIFLRILDREIARPDHQRSILTKQLRNGNQERARKAIADALACIDRPRGLATAL